MKSMNYVLFPGLLLLLIAMVGCSSDSDPLAGDFDAEGESVAQQGDSELEEVADLDRSESGGDEDILDSVEDADLMEAVELEEEYAERESEKEVEEGEAPVFDWVPIPTGDFEMGCSITDFDCPSDEYPRHTVSVNAFELLRTEVTQAQYVALTGENPSNFLNCPNCPVEGVDWQQAQDFCLLLDARLPSEAEWEYAARAGSTDKYYCGNDNTCLDGIAWYFDTAQGSSQPVGQKQANDFGLFDMLGNVFEWVQDCRHDSYTGAPSNGEVWSGGDCSHPGLRGGCWDGYRDKLRVSNRTWSQPPVPGTVGLRCARNQP